jgi:cell division transport system permease protein
MFPDATTKDAKAAQQKINKIPHVERTDFISKEKGLKQLKNEVGPGAIGQGITQLHGQNPLPLAIVVHPDDADSLPAIQDAIVPPGPNGKPKPISPGIEQVTNGQKAANTIRTVTNAVKIVLSVIAVLLLIISLLLIANTIRLSIYARRREVEVMRLVGATNWFIRWPFVIEGLVVGLTGAAIAVGMLWVGKVTIIDPLSANFALIDNFSTVGFVPLIIVLLGASIVVSMLGSGLTLRRFLRI